MRLFSDIAQSVVDPWLRHACRLAEKGRGTTSPNPLVGCVVVRDGQVAGEGFHARAGGPHAEVVALERAGEAARGATAYVTMEPCNHHGRTGPCTSALVEAGVARVVIGMRDPNPDVQGGGAEALQAAGVGVEYAPDESPFAEQNVEWLHRTRTGLPYVRVKTALTMDGHPALAPSRRSAITGPSLRELTMRLRASSDAVLVSAATVGIDDPTLAVEDGEGGYADRQPLRVVVSRAMAPPADARLFKDGHGPVLVFTGGEADPPWVVSLAGGGVETARYDAGRGLVAVMEALAARGAVSVLVEAGQGLFTALTGEDLADEVLLYHAGRLAGDGAPPLYGLSYEDAGGAPRIFDAVEAGIVDGEAVTVWRRAAEPPVPEPS